MRWVDIISSTTLRALPPISFTAYYTLLTTYFDLALSRISEGKIMESFSESLKNIKPEVNGLEMLKYTCRDWRIVFCSYQRQTLKEETFKRL